MDLPYDFLCMLWGMGVPVLFYFFIKEIFENLCRKKRTIPIRHDPETHVETVILPTILPQQDQSNVTLEVTSETNVESSIVINQRNTETPCVYSGRFKTTGDITTCDEENQSGEKAYQDPTYTEIVNINYQDETQKVSPKKLATIIKTQEDQDK